MLTKEQILLETIVYYSEDTKRRALAFDEERGNDLGECVYFNNNTSTMCAVGRCCIDPLRIENKYSGKGVVFLLESESDKILKPEYRGHDCNFWAEIQLLHDSDSNWGDNQLTELGKRVVNIILDRYSINKENFWRKLNGKVTN